MATSCGDIEALLEMDRFVRRMGVCSNACAIVAVVRDYLASWPEDRVLRLQARHAGWVPFDDSQQPYPLYSVADTRQVRGAIRIRCRELEASGARISPELLELDLFFYFVNESLEVHEPDLITASRFGQAGNAHVPPAAASGRNVDRAAPRLAA